VFVSSGDSGSAGCDSADFASPAVHGLAVSGFASTPYNVAVGGTDFYYSQYASGYGSSAVSSQLAQYWGTATTDSQAASLKSPIPEQPWDDTLGLKLGYPTAYSVAAGSGGPSSCATGVTIRPAAPTIPARRGIPSRPGKPAQGPIPMARATSPMFRCSRPTAST